MGAPNIFASNVATMKFLRDEFRAAKIPAALKPDDGEVGWW